MRTFLYVVTLSLIGWDLLGLSCHLLVEEKPF